MHRTPFLPRFFAFCRLWLGIILPACFAEAQSERGDDFPLERIRTRFFMDYQREYNPDFTLVALLPTLSNDCPYGRMLRTAFDAYFAQGLVWEAGQTKPRIQIVLIAPENVAKLSEGYAMSAEWVCVSDPEGEVFDWLRLPVPDDKTAPCVVYAVNKTGKLIYKDRAYSHQAGQLRGLTAALRSVSGKDSTGVAPVPNASLLGSAAPDFWADGKTRLSDLYTKRPVVIAFLSAPLSGSFPPEDEGGIWRALQEGADPEDESLLLAALDALRAKPSKRAKNNLPDDFIPIDQLPLNAEIVALCPATQALLHQWEVEIYTRYLRFVSVSNDALVQSYGLGDKNIRAVFVVDKEGRIVYEDRHFEAKPQNLKALHNKVYALGKP